MQLQRLWLTAVSTLLVCVTVPPVLSQEPTLYWVEANDGVLLATDVYLPEGEGPWPAILVRTLGGRSGRCDDRTENGYACVAQNLRGFGDSEGVYEYYQAAGRDGRVTVAWISEQPWSDGKVGTSGSSERGFTQYLLAPGAPEALRCLKPGVATPDLYHHWMFQGGALREALILASVPLGMEWALDVFLQHRLRDEWWETTQQPVTQPELVTAPGLHVGGWFDVYSQGTLDGFSIFQSRGGDGARGRQALIMGPWIHHPIGGMTAGTLIFPMNAVLDVDAMELAWYDYWLKGEDNGVDRWPAAYVYLMGAAWGASGIPLDPHAPGNVWLVLDGWPPPADQIAFYLGTDASLTWTVPSDGELELIMDPDNPVDTLGGANFFINGGPRDQRPVEARDDVLVFSTDELPAPLTVMGRISCTLWIRPDTTDLDLAVRLSDVYPTGHSMLVTDGIQRARMRCGDDQECFLTPGEPTEITVDLWSTALVFNKGHRIRISVSGSNWPRFEVNPNHGGDLNSDEPGIIAHPDLLFGPDYPSRLTLPIWTPPPRQAGGRVGP